MFSHCDSQTTFAVLQLYTQEFYETVMNPKP